MRHTDRSRIESRWHCPALAYWRYMANGHGWDTKPGVDLQLGSAIHEAIEHAVMDTVRRIHLRRPPQPFTWNLEEALAGFPGWEPEQARRILEFAVAVVRETFRESRAWDNIADAATGFTYVATELEFSVPLPDGYYNARPDLLYSFGNNSAMIVNIKSSSAAAEWSKWGIQPAIVGEWWALEKLGLNPRASWVFHVNKGRKMKPDGAMAYFASPLFVGYEKGGEIQPSYRAGWKRIWLWEHMTAGEWAEKLKTTYRDALESIYEVSGPHLPSPESLRAWEAAVEADISWQRQMENLRADEFERHMGRACVWPSQCAAFNLCWGTASLDPEANGFMIRVPNHPQEAENG